MCSVSGWEAIRSAGGAVNGHLFPFPLGAAVRGQTVLLDH